jgi:hypothetical protein
MGRLPLPVSFHCFHTFGQFFPVGYVRGVAALMIIGIITDFFGTLCTGLGLRSTDPNKKYKYYRVAIYALLVARKYIIFISFYCLSIDVILLKTFAYNSFITLSIVQSF